MRQVGPNGVTVDSKSPQLRRLTIFSRPGCHLCEEMRAVVERVSQRVRVPFEIQEVDISTDPALEALYGRELPVLMIDGRKVAKYRLADDDLVRKLERNR